MSRKTRLRARRKGRQVRADERNARFRMDADGAVTVFSDDVELEIEDGKDDDILPFDLTKSDVADVAEREAAGEPEPGEIKRFGRIIKSDDELRLVYGVVYEPYTVDSQGEWADENDIRKAAHLFFEHFRDMNVQHRQGLNPELVPVESYVTLEDMTIGEEVVKKGTWVLVSRVDDDLVWQDVKEGRLTGYSMEGEALRAAG